MSMKLWKVLARNSYVYSNHVVNQNNGMELCGEYALAFVVLSLTIIGFEIISESYLCGHKAVRERYERLKSVYY